MFHKPYNVLYDSKYYTRFNFCTHPSVSYVLFCFIRKITHSVCAYLVLLGYLTHYLVSWYACLYKCKLFLHNIWLKLYGIHINYTYSSFFPMIDNFMHTKYRAMSLLPLFWVTTHWQGLYIKYIFTILILLL